VTGDPTAVPEPVREFDEIFTRHGLAEVEIGRLQREDFLARARAAFAVVHTAELRPYGNILLVKGVVNRYDSPAAPNP
jgi:L-fucose mutarotase